MDTALGLPEIRSHIGTHLPQKDISSCRLVSRPWHSSFTPFIFQTLDLHTDTHLPAFIVSTLARNIQHLQELTLSDLTPPETNIILLPQQDHALLQLKKLFLRPGSRDTQYPPPPRDLSLVSSLLEYAGSTLRTLELNNVSPMHSIEFWKVVSRCCPNLQTLTVTDAMERGALLQVWRMVSILEGLTHLQLDMMQQQDVIDIVQDSSLQEPWNQRIVRVKSLHAGQYSSGISESHFLAWMQLCPEISSIWYSFDPHSNAASLVRLLIQGSWKALQSFRAMDGDRLVSDSALAEILKALPRIQRLDLTRCPFGVMSFEALQGHPLGMSVLQELDLWGCEGLTSKMICTFLEDCPRLEMLNGTTLEGKDILKSRPWASASTLKELRVRICLTCPPEDVATAEEETRAILSRLSALKRLEEVDFSRGTRDGQPQGSLPISLENGLDHLKTWTRLRDVRLKYHSRWIKEAEVVWMLDHWPQMQGIELKLWNAVDLDDPRLEERQITVRKRPRK